MIIINGFSRAWRFKEVVHCVRRAGQICTQKAFSHLYYSKSIIIFVVEIRGSCSLKWAPGLILPRQWINQNQIV